MEELKKRNWHYIQKPQAHGISCPVCKSENLDWSEYESHIWCYKCEKDYDSYDNPMSGPVPVRVAQMLGLSLDIYNMETNKVERFNVNTGQYEPEENNI